MKVRGEVPRRGRSGKGEEQMLLENIRTLCKERGLSISTLEKAAKLGNGTISRWGESSPRVDNLLSVARCLGVTLEDLLGPDARDSA